MKSSTNPISIESKNSPVSKSEEQEIVELLNKSLNNPHEHPYNWTPVAEKSNTFASRWLGLRKDTSKIVLGALARGKQVRARCIWLGFYARHLEVEVSDIKELRSLLAAFDIVKIRAKEVNELRAKLNQKKAELRELKKEINDLESDLKALQEPKSITLDSVNFGGHANLFSSDRDHDAASHTQIEVKSSISPKSTIS